MKDTVTLMVCLAVSLKLTNDSMRANAEALPMFHRESDGPVPYAGQAGARYVKVDAGFALNFAGPLVLQGALTTCYCFMLYVLTSVVVTVCAYGFVMLKAAATAVTMINGDPLKALDAALELAAGEVKKAVEGSTAAEPFGKRFMDGAIRTVFENTMASTALLFQVAAVQAVVSAVVIASGLTFAVAGKPKWAFLHKKSLYVDVQYLARASTATTASAFPFVCVVFFARTDMWAKWKAAVWRFMQ